MDWILLRMAHSRPTGAGSRHQASRWLLGERSVGALRPCVLRTRSSLPRQPRRVRALHPIGNGAAQQRAAPHRSHSLDRRRRHAKLVGAACREIPDGRVRPAHSPRCGNLSASTHYQYCFVQRSRLCNVVQLGTCKCMHNPDLPRDNKDLPRCWRAAIATSGVGRVDAHAGYYADARSN